MKHLKVMAALLSAVMCMSMLMTPAAALADGASVPEEAQTAEETQETEEPEEPADEEEEQEEQLPGDEASQEAMDAVASGKCGKKLKWSLDKKGTLKITGKGAMNNYAPKNALNNYTRPWDKYSSRIKKVVFSKGVTYIGSMSFCDCTNLKSVSFPKKLKTIGFGAFTGCTCLKSVSLPKNVRTIGDYAFAITGIESVSIKKGVTEIRDHAFQKCNSLKTVNIPASVKTIGSYAFADCESLATVKVPVSGLNSIGDHAFYNCDALVGFDVPLSVTSIGDYAFAECLILSPVKINVNQKNNLPEHAFEGSSYRTFNETHYCMIGDSFNDGPFTYRVSDPAIDGTGTVDVYSIVAADEKLVIPAYVSHTDDYGYTTVKYKVTRINGILSQIGDLKNLKTLVIGSNVSVIEDNAFAGCPLLESVTGGAGLKTIGSKAFANCPKLKVFNITSKTLKKIGSYAFSGDMALTTLQLKKTTKLCKAGVKNSLAGSSVKTVKVKKKKLKKYKKYFKKKNSGKSVKVKK